MLKSLITHTLKIDNHRWFAQIYQVNETQKTKLILCPIAEILSTHNQDSTADAVLVMSATVMKLWTLDKPGT